MIRLIAAIALALASPLAWANCTIQTFTDTTTGRITLCTTCCYGGNCTVNCTTY